MARVTVEDCIDKLENRFELVMLASQRARKIGTGAPLTVEKDNDKKTVISLREIAEETINTAEIKEEMIQGYQRFLPQDPEEEIIDLMDGEKEWGEMADSAATGMYAGEEITAEGQSEETNEESENDPTLGDIAGV
ncbi:MAG: DNA-directed RNA polymerase subunit omega [Alphaproteobacteria bacterium]|nr:DNA-directed RNA polymerase subunit omega [Alphaproteobacteria bacterium]